MVSYSEVQSLFQTFKSEADKEPLNVEKVESLLSDLKIGFTQLQALQPGSAFSSQEAKEQLAFSREVLEHAVLFSVKAQDIASFRKHYAQLKSKYQEAELAKIERSSRFESITGLNLLFLLSSNLIAEFHTELELIPYEQHNNPYIKHSIELEQYLMEGSYTKVLEAKNTAPSETYAYFMSILINTVRDEMASCIEKAYIHLTGADAKKLLRFDDDKSLLEYATEREWLKEGDKFIFEKVDVKLTRNDIPATKLISRTLAYARELERII